MREEEKGRGEDGEGRKKKIGERVVTRVRRGGEGGEKVGKEREESRGDGGGN